MKNLLQSGGRLAGAIGVLVCAVAATWRLLGHYDLGGFSVGALLQVGTAAVGIGCFLLLLTPSDHR